ncbi:alpha/beta hydrolase family protein [Flavisolibacter nicotianae]|uniref:alpha/beta hydrolase family protein n=1 Tax=Flavisolibacter nicotianae TaxID=2364882 RepID=UPI000EAF0A47|nr:alpha/beta fold hydrolase [Flavisolibacter nicotianae]
MKKIKNFLLAGAGGKPILADIFYGEGKPKPVVLYAHGFNGFKDWASFDLIAEQFVAAGFCFVKFNFSHGGTAPHAPEEFVDLTAYGNNNYTKELFDLQQVIDWALAENNPHAAAIDKERLYLLGHSRGGGVVLLKAAEEPRVKAVVTWAAVSQSKTPWGSWPEDRIRKWKESGVEHYTNSRTGQQMPLYYQLYEDYQANKERLDIGKAVQGLTIPVLICHGTRDEAVPVENAYKLKEAAKQGDLFLVDSDHVFGRKHPWTSDELPAPMQQVVEKTIQFFREKINT